MKRVALLLGALSALGIGACAATAPEPAPVPVLGNTRWVLAGSKADAASRPRLEFTSEGRVAGFTGCNMMSGSYRLEGDRLEVAAATTKRACLGPGGEAERKLLAVLSERPRASLQAGRLVLADTQGTALEFDPAP